MSRVPDHFDDEACKPAEPGSVAARLAEMASQLRMAAGAFRRLTKNVERAAEAIRQRVEEENKGEEWKQ